MSAPGLFVRFGPAVILFTALRLGIATPNPALAVQPSLDAAAYEVDRRGQADEDVPARSREAAALRSGLSRSLAWTEFVHRHRGWVARWDLRSQVPERLQGPPAPVPGFFFVDATDAEAAARAFLDEGARSWIPVDELTWVRTTADRGGYWVHFQQTHHGVLVWDSRVSVRLDRQGSVLLVTNRTASGLPAPKASRLAPGTALAAARAGLPGAPVPSSEPSLTFLPIQKSDQYESRLTWRYEFRTSDPPGVWVSFVDAADGTLLWRYDNLKYGEVHGQVTGAVEPVTADNDFQDRPFPHATVTCFPSAAETVAVVTDAAGNFSLVTSGNVGRTAQASLRGPYGVAIDAVTGQVPTFSELVPDSDSARVDLPFGLSGDAAAERDAYYHIMVAHDHIQRVEPGFDLLDYPLPITVNIDRTCNATWDGVGVNFYRAGGGCVNTARIADVVYHEYGHGITDMLYRPFQTSGAMSEGFSDYFAATITSQPMIGIGFRGPGTRLRRIDVDRVFPQDLVGESHTDGLIIASALWDLREALGAPRTDSLFHFARYGYADNFDDYFFDVLVADDDNGNVYDGTPNLETIATIFRAHGIGDYGIHVSHEAHPDTEDTTQALALTASFLSVYALDPALVRIHVSIACGDVTTTIDSVMTPTGGVREFAMVLPAQPPETVVSYYFTAGDVNGNSVTSPENGPDDPFIFRVGTDATAPTIQHEPLPDQPVESTAIRVRATVIDRLDQPLGPVTLYREDDGGSWSIPMTPAESGEYLAELPADGIALGDTVGYRIDAYDGAVQPNRTASPPTGRYSFCMVRGFARDLEANDGGWQGDHDWVWGQFDQVGAYSGQRAWGTNQGSGYQNLTRSELVTPPIDLSGWNSAGLLFRHFLRSESGYDGGFVEVSSQGGPWKLLHPEPDYAARIAAAEGSPGYSGRTEGWEPAQFDLSSYLGQSDIRLRFVFASDAGLTGLGWYLDDISVVERQVTGRPTNLQAQSGKDGSIPLRWDPPAGAKDGGSQVTGYKIYRCLSADGRPGLLTPEPVLFPQYRDTTAVNGEPYQYNVTTLYGNRESPFSEPVLAMAYVAVCDMDASPLTIATEIIGVVDTTLTLRNAGTGRLEVNAYLADTSQTIDDVRVAIPVSTDLARRSDGRASRRTPEYGGRRYDGLTARWRPAGRAEVGTAMPAEWDTLVTDADDSPGIEPDLEALLMRESGDTLSLRVTAHHESMFPPLLSASMLIPLDTDQNRATGYGGGEFVILAGAEAFARFGQRAVLLDDSLRVVHGLMGFTLHYARIDFHMHKAVLGWFDAITTEVRVTVGPEDELVDQMPDGFETPWLDHSPDHLTVEGGRAGTLHLALNSQTAPVGEYRAKVILETNDAARPIIEVPVTFRVQTVTPVMLSDLTAQAEEAGVVLSWRTPADLDYAGFDVYRRLDLPEEAEMRLTEEPLTPTADGAYRFVDTGAVPGRPYEYRVAGVAANGERTFFGPLAVTARGLEPPRALYLAPGVPNPARYATVLRYGLPRVANVLLTLYSPDGRLVRTLVESPGQAAGHHVSTWDGRDDRGRAVSAGVYLVRLESGRQRCAQKVLWVR